MITCSGNHRTEYLLLLDADVDSFSFGSLLFCGRVSEARLGGFFPVAAAGPVELACVLASWWLFAEPELLRLVGSCSCDVVDSESELDELLSEPLLLSLDDDVPDVDPELDSVVLVDCKQIYFCKQNTKTNRSDQCV